MESRDGQQAPAANVGDEARALKERLVDARSKLARAHEEMSIVMHDVSELSPALKTSAMAVVEGVFTKLQEAERDVADAAAMLDRPRERETPQRRTSDRAVSLRLFDLDGHEVHRRGTLATEPGTLRWHDVTYYLASTEPEVEDGTRVFVYRATRP